MRNLDDGKVSLNFVLVLTRISVSFVIGSFSPSELASREFINGLP